jgi:cyclopropane-fatty-acyl-phospholipid synthase
MSNAESSYPSNHVSDGGKSARLIDRLGRKFVLAQLARLQSGQLILKDCEEQHCLGAEAGDAPVTINVLDTRFYGAVAFGGAIGAAESYIQGHWACDDLTRVVQLLLRNRDVLDGMDHGTARLATPLRKLLHIVNRNTRSGSRRNIAAHYDLGNEFFGIWLDKTMMYSSAVFERENMTLEEASEAKLDRICRKLELSPDDHVLEIGTGWGGFAVYAATHYGCRVTTTTISREQYEFAKKRVSDAGLDDRVRLLLKDYRDLDGCYDKLVSIEMIEAVGHEYMDTYFGQCSQLLKDDGMMLIQAITIADQRYESALKSVDFIQRYIFPGGFLPSVTAMLSSATQSSNMRIYHLEDIGAHYAETLKRWRESFAANLNKIWPMGYGEEFLRMWHYYYCYCEGAFVERAIGNVQVLFVKPGSRRDPLVPSLSK